MLYFMQAIGIKGQARRWPSCFVRIDAKICLVWARAVLRRTLPSCAPKTSSSQYGVGTWRQSMTTHDDGHA